MDNCFQFKASADNKLIDDCQQELNYTFYKHNLGVTVYYNYFTLNHITTKLFYPIILAAGLTVSHAQNQVVSNLEVVQPVAMGISQPMRDLPISSKNEKSDWNDGIIPSFSPPNFNRNKIEVEKDGSLIEYQGPYSASTITKNFDGVPINPLEHITPPSPSGDVGPNHYVQMVTNRTQIWDKNGISLAGPFNNSAFWAALGPPFSTTNFGFPIVLYDDMADRWMVSQTCSPYANGPYYILVAVSKTADPTGQYWQYAYSFANRLWPPKYGVWPDGYYMAADAWAPVTGFYVGNYVAVLDRNTMLTGGLATMQYILNTKAAFLLPSDCDGVPPPSGAPNYFLTSYNRYFIIKDTLFLYQYHVDWGSPSNSTFTGPLRLTTPVVNDLTSGTTIPQLGTANKLDNLGLRPMNRLQYRNFGDHQAMVVCMTGNVGSDRAGIRWWELRKTSGDWSIFHEGTHAPADALHRWLGSIAMDINGIIALGYSISGSTIKPGIRYTGRLPTDPPGVMTLTETEIQAGLGSQTTISLWGHYSQMTVDPLELGTFWYTNEYLPADGNSNWKTKIAAFKFDITSIGIMVIPEGFYNVSLNRLNMKDTVRAYLKADDGSGFYVSIDSAKAVIDSITFNGDFKFVNAPSGTYYLVLKHRNSIETWSKPGGEAIIKGSTINYDFTNAQNKAYGNNMVQKGTKWCVYGGDVNQDGVVDLSDLSLVDTDNLNFQTGYRATDINGDLLIDLSDLQIVDINNLRFVSKVTP